MMRHKNGNRIGVFAGTFNPVHSGHIAFALQALKEAQLDVIYFLPERQPRNKPGTEHYGHRVAMLTRATRPHRRLKVLEGLVDTHFSVVRTLPQLQQLFPNSHLIFLFGSDTVASMPTWPNIRQLFKKNELVIGLRGNDTKQLIAERISGWRVRPASFNILQSYAPKVSSSQVREALFAKRWVPGLLKSVERYSDRNWLYVSVV